MFNVRIKRFADAEQVQIFSVPLHSKGEVSHKKFDPETREILVQKRLKKSEYKGEWAECPFSDDLDQLEFLSIYDEDLHKKRLEEKEESIRQSRARSINAIYDIARSNFWEWFVTFTFDPKRSDRYDYKECSKKLSKWFNHTREVCPDMVYLVVPEQHKDGAFHFHGLFSGIDYLPFTFSGKLDKQGRPIYNIGSYKWGFTTATKVGDSAKASSYLCKYVTKDLCAVTAGKKRYWSSKNVKRPEIIELDIMESYLERIKQFLIGDAYHLREIHTAYTNVVYIDLPIYTTNTDFSNRLTYKRNKNHYSQRNIPFCHTGSCRETAW